MGLNKSNIDDTTILNWIESHLAQPHVPIQIGRPGKWTVSVIDPWWTARNPDKDGKVVYERISEHDGLRDAVIAAMEQEEVLLFERGDK